MIKKDLLWCSWSTADRALTCRGCCLRLSLSILLSSTDSRSMGRADPAPLMSSLPLFVWADLSLLRKNKQLWPFFDNTSMFLVSVHNVDLSILVLYSGIPNQVLCLCDAGLLVVQPPPLEGKQEGDGVQAPHNAASLGGGC